VTPLELRQGKGKLGTAPRTATEWREYTTINNPIIMIRPPTSSRVLGSLNRSATPRNDHNEWSGWFRNGFTAYLKEASHRRIEAALMDHDRHWKSADSNCHREVLVLLCIDIMLITINIRIKAQKDKADRKEAVYTLVTAIRSTILSHAMGSIVQTSSSDNATGLRASLAVVTAR
jgi:hypothetical protein